MITLSNEDADEIRRLCAKIIEQDVDVAKGARIIQVLDNAIDEVEMDDTFVLLSKFTKKVRRKLREKSAQYRVILNVDSSSDRPVALQMFNIEYTEWHTTQRFESVSKLNEFFEYSLLPENHPTKVAARQAYADMH